MSAAQGKTIVIDLDGRTARISGKDDLYQGDSYANDIVVEFVRSGAPAQISGYTASGEFERSDGVKVPCTGTLSGNVATIKLDEHCYYRDGVYRLTVRLSKSNEDITRTVLEITGTVQSRSDGPTVDVDETLVNVDKVLELYDEMKDATKNVQSATDAANDAAAAAQQATTQANNAANNANVAAGSVNSSINQAASAATNANNAAKTANTAAANATAKASQADSAAARALTAASKPPQVDSTTGTWRVWDDAAQAYKDTQYPAQGPIGDKGDKGDDAQVTAANIQKALGYTPADPAKVTVSAEKIKEALGYTPANETSTEQIFSELDKVKNNKLDNRGLPYNRVVATDYQGSIQFLNFTEVGEDVTATKIQQALGYIPLKEITAEGIETALGYEPADKEVTDWISQTKLGLWNNTPNKYVVTDSAGSIRFADPPAGSGGVPPTGPYQMLVTDGDQSQVWEERTHYPYIGLVEILPEVEYKNIEYEPGTISQNITAYMKGPIVAGKTYYITFGDERLECLAYEEDSFGMTVIAENNDFISARVAVIYYSDGKSLLSVNDGDANPNPIVKVEGPGVKYKKLDKEYLPDDIGGGGDGIQILHGVADGSKVTFEKTLEEICDLARSGELSKYKILVDTDVTTFGRKTVEMNTVNWWGDSTGEEIQLNIGGTFYNVAAGLPREAWLSIYKSGGEYSVNFSNYNIADLPEPDGSYEGKVLGVEGGRYAFVDMPSGGAGGAGGAALMLLIVDAGGALVMVDIETGEPITYITPEVLLQYFRQGAQISFLVMSETDAGMSIKMYSISEIGENADGLYAILGNHGNGTPIMMAADGTLSYQS